MISVSCGRLRAGFIGLGCLALAAGHADAACYSPTQQLPAQVVSDFVANSGQLLQQNPNGGAQMIARVRDLAASNPAALPAIMSLVTTANKDQKVAIGTGLAQAARVCVPSDQAQANEIQRAVAASPDQDVRVAYQAVTGDVALGAAGGGGGGGGAGGGVGGATNGSPSSGSNSGTATGGGGGVVTRSFTFSPSVGSGPSAPSFTTTSGTAASVSP
jgi:hypothetical protein